MNHILVVDDEAEIRSSLEEILREEGYGVAGAADAEEAMALLRDVPYDVVLLDIWLPGRDGLEVLAEIRTWPAETRPEVVMISGHGTIETAVKATKLGAYDFLEKPLSLERTLIVVKNAVEARRLRTENVEFKRQFSAASVLTGESVPVKALRQQIRLMAPTNGRVLIYGESGTGKELIARSIHAESLRRDRVFVELNCAAIPEAHIEAELFGDRHGAQPGESRVRDDQRGTLERADGGTLFLDEVGDMSLKTQAKVLSALDDQMFTPVGGTQPLRVDVRLIASTNKDLEEEIAKGNFREDLFYRLNVVPFFVPPLRERKQDIPLLAREFLAEFGRQYGRPRMEIGEEALETLAPVPLAGQRARAEERDRARAHPQSPRAAHRAQASAAAHAQGRRALHGGVLEPAAGARRLRARIHSEEDRRGAQQHQPRRGTAGPGAQPSLPEDEGLGNRSSRVAAYRMSARLSILLATPAGECAVPLSCRADRACRRGGLVCPGAGPSGRSSTQAAQSVRKRATVRSLTGCLGVDGTAVGPDAAAGASPCCGRAVSSTVDFEPLVSSLFRVGIFARCVSTKSTPSTESVYCALSDLAT